MMPQPLAVLLSAIGFLVVASLAEVIRHRRNPRRVPIRIRIHVNGTRGKSSVTRLIAAGLREGVWAISVTKGWTSCATFGTAACQPARCRPSVRYALLRTGISPRAQTPGFSETRGMLSLSKQNGNGTEHPRLLVSSNGNGIHTTNGSGNGKQAS